MATGELLEEELTRSIIGAFYDAYNALGYGFLEHIYVRALEFELKTRGHTVGREVYVPVRYKGFDLGFQRMDMLVDGRVVVETKSTSSLSSIAGRQVHNYLRATQLEVGLILHFGPKPQFGRLIFRNRGTRP